MSPLSPILPPEWWNNRALYNEMDNMPLEGWIWEFMRRDILLEALVSGPVDAMNPRPDYSRIRVPSLTPFLIDSAELIPEDLHILYKPWNHDSWLDDNNNRKQLPFYTLPSVLTLGRGGWPLRFQGQRYPLDDQVLRNNCEIRIDLNRKDTTLKKDFEETLAILRLEHPPARIRKPRFNLETLKVWDLRQFNVSYGRIAMHCFTNLRNPIQSIRNANNRAIKMINNRDWIYLTRL